MSHCFLSSALFQRLCSIIGLLSIAACSPNIIHVQQKKCNQNMLNGCWQCDIAPKPYVIKCDTFDFTRCGSTFDKFKMTYQNTGTFNLRRPDNDCDSGRFYVNHKTCEMTWNIADNDVHFTMSFSIYPLTRKRILLFLANDSITYFCKKKTLFKH
jgi:hypothetical protein